MKRRECRQVFGSGGEGIISMEEFGGEKWRFGVTEFARGGRELRIKAV